MKSLFATTALIALTGMAYAETAAGDWLVRGRVISVNPSNTGGESSIGGKPKAGTDVVPEIDLTYFATPNIGFELIAATTEHKTRLARGTNVALGSVRVLPPTLTAQYHFDCPQDLGNLKPYLGAGITYAHFYDAEHPGLNSVEYDNSFGTALQAGADYKLTDKIYLNADVKKIFLSTDVTVNNTITAKANLNPVIAGVGIGYRF